MKFFLLALIAFALPLCANADVTGKWSGSIEFKQDGEGHAETAYLILKQDGATLTGSGGPSEDHQMPIRKGNVDGNNITFEIALDEDRVMSSILTRIASRAASAVRTRRPVPQRRPRCRSSASRKSSIDIVI